MIRAAVAIVDLPRFELVYLQIILQSRIQEAQLPPRQPRSRLRRQEAQVVQERKEEEGRVRSLIPDPTPAVQYDQVSEIQVIRNTIANFRSGKISEFVRNWEQLTSDSWIIDNVRGFRIELEDLPEQWYRPHPLRLSASDSRALNNALEELHEAGIIQPWEGDCEDIYVSTVFPVPKRDGSARVILDLSHFNEFVEKHHFKMDTNRDAINFMRPNCYLASIDFKHAYYSVRVTKEHRRFLCFEWKGRLFSFSALPQGLRSAPRTFTKLLKPAFATLREAGFTMLGYIDDSLFVEESARDLQEAVAMAVELFDDLGLTIHPKKSILQPIQSIEFLGFVLDSRTMTVALRPDVTTRSGAYSAISRVHWQCRGSRTGC